MIEKVTFFFVYLVEGITAWQYLSSQFRRKMGLAFSLGIFTMGYSLGYLLFDLSFVWLNTVVFTLLNFSLAFFLYSCPWKSCLFHTILLTCLTFGSEIVAEFFLGWLYGGAEKYQSNPTILVLLCALSKFLYYSLSKVCLWISRSSSASPPDTGISGLLLGSFSISTIFILIIMAHAVISCDLTSEIEVLMMIGALILLLSDIAIYAGYQYSQKLAHQNLELQLVRQKDQAEEAYFKALEEQYERQRVFIHDIRAHLTALKDIALENREAQVVEYVSELEADPALQNKVRYCGNIMLNVVLSRYKELCESNGILFSIDVRDIDLDFFSQKDITAIFGNLLENAVEAALTAEFPSVELVMGSQGDTHSDARLFVSLINSCYNEPVADGTGGFLTRKANKLRHGVGQRSIRKAVEKYGGSMDQFYDESTHSFHTSILFQKSSF